MSAKTALSNQESMVSYLRDAKNCLEDLIQKAALLNPNDAYTLGMVFDSLFRTKGEISFILQDQEGWLDMYKESV